MPPRRINFAQIRCVAGITALAGFLLQYLAVTEDGIERGTQFVAHIGKKLALGLTCGFRVKLVTQCNLDSLVLGNQFLLLLLDAFEHAFRCAPDLPNLGAGCAARRRQSGQFFHVDFPQLTCEHFKRPQQV